MPMTEEEAKPYSKPIPHWIPETRTVIVVWMMVSTFFILVLLMIFGTPKGDNGQLLNTLIGIYAGTGFVTSITWWMGSAKGTDTDNKMKDSMAEAVRPAVPAAATVVVSWWSLMEPDEKTAIEARAKTDTKIKAIYEALMAGKAEPPDIAALVVAGLLKQERAAFFKTT